MPAKTELYERDFYHWTQDQAAQLRAKAWHALDIEHLAEEIESLGNEQEHAVASHLLILTLHLLKVTCQQQRRRSWLRSIRNARNQLDLRFRRRRACRCRRRLRCAPACCSPSESAAMLTMPRSTPSQSVGVPVSGSETSTTTAR